MRAACSILALMLATIPAGCGPGPLPPTAAAPVFSAIRFFDGRTQGHGTLHKILSRGEPILVEGRGRIEPGGALVLEQDVREGGKPVKHRRWRIAEVAPGRYAGSLSDAAGPVSGETAGNRLHLHFGMNGGLDAEQWLTLSADGRVAQNRMIVRKFGIVVARLDETIRKIG